MAIQDLIDDLKSLSAKISQVDVTIDKVVDEKQDVLLSLNRDQMLLGRDSEGNTFSPGYTEDPYFKTPKLAKSYKERKIELESEHSARMRFSNVQLYPNKDSNIPNLIVTGPFQDNMFISVTGSSHEIGSTYIDAPDIEQKYNGKVFGLAPKSKEYFFEYFIKPELLKLLKL